MYRILVLYDVDGWAYHNRALALQKYAPEGFQVEIMPWTQLQRRRPPECDLIFNLDSAASRRWANAPHVVSWNSGPTGRVNLFNMCAKRADWVIFNNEDCWKSRSYPRSCCISNGVDTDIFKVTTPPSQREDVVFWTGSDSPKKGKGVELLLDAAPLLQRYGFTTEFHPVANAQSKSFSTEQMVQKYNEAAYVVCMSAEEATPNTTLEGMACGCVPVSTWVGNIREFHNGQNGVIVERSVESLVSGLIRARDDRVKLSESAIETMQQWSYGAPGFRSRLYFELFEALINRRMITPYSYRERMDANRYSA